MLKFINLYKDKITDQIEALVYQDLNEALMDLEDDNDFVCLTTLKYSNGKVEVVETEAELAERYNQHIEYLEHERDELQFLNAGRL